MSVRIQALVWERSEQKGSDLLVLLAIADNARDDGTAYPGMAYLSAKTRLSERGVRYAVQRLLETGELELLERGGRRGKQRRANLYRINLERLQSLPVRFPNRQDDAFPTGNGLHPNRHIEPSVEPPTTPPTRSAKDEKQEQGIWEVFEFWNRRYSPRSKLDEKRKRRINARLNEGFTAHDLKRAIAAAAHDEWLSGKHPDSPGYLNKLHTLLRDREQVERLLDLADRIEAQLRERQQGDREVEDARAAELRAMRGE